MALFVLLISSLLGLYFTYGLPSQSIVGVYKSCDEAKSIYTNGADVGECFIDTQNNKKSIQFVSSVTEKYPTQGTFCNIQTTANSVYVFTCDYAVNSDGSQIKVCKNDADCESLNCVNWMCQSEGRTCSTPGETKCSTTEKYQQCLSNGKWSGILSCEIGKEECLYGSCQSTICTPEETKCVSTVLYQCDSKGLSWMNKGNSNICNPGNVPDSLNAQPYNPLSCVTKWSCTVWPECYNNEQTRMCIDLNGCEDDSNKPTESRACTSTNINDQIINDSEEPINQEAFTPTSCISDWDCDSWSECYNNEQTRTCEDFNVCPNVESPVLTKECSEDICDNRFTCTNWSECTHNVQTRMCTDLNGCEDQSSIPSEEQYCQDNLDTTGIDTECGSGLQKCSNGACKEDCSSSNIIKTLSFAGLGFSIFLLILLMLILMI
jgi:hypothetical protein